MIAGKVAARESFELEVAGETLTLEPDDVLVETTAPENLCCCEESATVVAIDTRLTDELIQEGLVRDLVRHIQNMRKDSGFNVDDRITIEYATSGKLSEAIQSWSDYIRQETLANSLRASGGESFPRVKIAGEEIGLKLEKA
jgi:isoleucyl-tRNA synthetase